LYGKNTFFWGCLDAGETGCRYRNKKANGRRLEGKVWDGMPAMAT
jgi:protein gp37